MGCPKIPAPTRLTSLFLVLLALSGCTAEHYRKSADKEVHKILEQKSPFVPNMETNFTIAQNKTIDLSQLPINNTPEEAFGANQNDEIGAGILNLVQSLEIAVNHSREYQNQKEIVFLAALNLALARHTYTPLLFGNANTYVQNQPKDVAKAVDALAGTQTALLQQDTDIVQQYNITGHSAVSMQYLMQSGARLANSFTIDFLKFLNGNGQLFIRSSLAGTITQPLLRGFGYRVTMENLNQAERTMLYAVRDYTQYRKDFAVRVAQNYFGVLQAKDAVRNAWRGYRNFQQNAERGKAFAEEGRIPQSELGQLQQAELTGEASLINSIRLYRFNLDQFKILLGIPVGTKLILDDRDLDQLVIEHPVMTPEEAAKVALATRLDLYTLRDRVEDARRHIYVAKDSLKMQLDFILSGNIDSHAGNNNPFDLDFKRAQGYAGFNMDLPFDRLPQRNNYRSTLIEKERSERELENRIDQVKLQVNESWRALDQAKRNFELSELGVALSNRRVEEQELRATLGRGTARDLLEAQNDLIAAKNARTQALVNHTIARLQFWDNMGILMIKPNGQWEEVQNAKQL